MKTIEKVRTNVYLNSEIKAQALNIFKQYGLGLSDAFNMFLTQAVMEKGIPFIIKIPNDETVQAMEEVKKDIGETISYEDHIEEMKKCIS
jgi:DNA-damage-inducible protein J